MSDAHRIYNQKKGIHDITTEIEARKAEEKINRLQDRLEGHRKSGFQREAVAAKRMLEKGAKSQIEIPSQEALEELVKKAKVEGYKQFDRMPKEPPSNPLKNQVFNEFMVKYRNPEYRPVFDKALPAAAAPTLAEGAAAVALPIAAFLYPNSVATDEEEMDQRYQALMEKMSK